MRQCLTYLFAFSHAGGGGDGSQRLVCLESLSSAASSYFSDNLVSRLGERLHGFAGSHSPATRFISEISQRKVSRAAKLQRMISCVRRLCRGTRFFHLRQDSISCPGGVIERRASVGNPCHCQIHQMQGTRSLNSER